ncbi:MAG: acyl-CoA thioesterase II [Deltaproteobacteria bacterium]|nr:acyl-CoA thioesterase II [Deltaproteobacteria bacterium]MBI3387359.1 acyl-CoA thioesterase II [Deltaproteobacteria bacterium]
MSTALRNLTDLLDLEELEVNIFRGVSPKEDRQRVFGGQVAGQALVAAGRTVSEGWIHSLHAYFLRPGDPKIPILYEVDRIRDGKSFTSRRVVAIQHGHAILHLSASFHKLEEGLDHQTPMPEVPPPESLPTFQERMKPFREQLGTWVDRERPIDMRMCDPIGSRPDTWRSPEAYIWLRADGRLPDDPMLHACVVTYASDMTLLDSTLRPHGLTWAPDRKIMSASIDHAMWFHRPFRADEWMLYAQVSPSASYARGLATGSIFSQDGRLLVSVAQEGLIRKLE